MPFYKYKKKTIYDIKDKEAIDIAQFKASNLGLTPVKIEGRQIAKSWWGKAWNKNIESYADFSNRLPRGKSYVRANTILDLKINKGTIEAIVQGSRRNPYIVKIHIDEIERFSWLHIVDLCNHRIDSLEGLISGDFPKELEVLFTDKKYGLFPSSREIHFSSSCPDSASMCKHVAATLYGVGARLDDNPMLFFELRNFESEELIKKSMEKKLESMFKNVGKKSKREISADEIGDIFNL